MSIKVNTLTSKESGKYADGNLQSKKPILDVTSLNEIKQPDTIQQDTLHQVDDKLQYHSSNEINSLLLANFGLGKLYLDINTCPFLPANTKGRINTLLTQSIAAYEKLFKTLDLEPISFNKLKLEQGFVYDGGLINWQEYIVKTFGQPISDDIKIIDSIIELIKERVFNSENGLYGFTSKAFTDYENYLTTNTPKSKLVIKEVQVLSNLIIGNIFKIV